MIMMMMATTTAAARAGCRTSLAVRTGNIIFTLRFIPRTMLQILELKKKEGKENS
jgi:hypothetical protein